MTPYHRPHPQCLASVSLRSMGSWLTNTDWVAAAVALLAIVVSAGFAIWARKPWRPRVLVHTEVFSYQLPAPLSTTLSVTAPNGMKLRQPHFARITLTPAGRRHEVSAGAFENRPLNLYFGEKVAVVWLISIDGHPDLEETEDYYWNYFRRKAAGEFGDSGLGLAKRDFAKPSVTFRPGAPVSGGGL